MQANINDGAVSVFDENNAMDDFPILKAFQQYIDAEQAKSRKRLLMLSIFFGALLTVVVSVFVLLVLKVSQRNQSLNDRLVEYAMRERERPAQGAVVVQPTPTVDNSAIIALTSRIEDMQKKLVESEEKARKLAAESEEKSRLAAQAAAEAAKPKPPSAQELEIIRLKALLADEAKKAAEEKERQRQIELEAYRRKHYPECYAPVARQPRRRTLPVEIDESEDDEEAITYFDDEDREPVKPKQKVTTKKRQSNKVENTSAKANATTVKPTINATATVTTQAKTSTQSKTTNSIDVKVKGSSAAWKIPEE